MPLNLFWLLPVGAALIGALLVVRGARALAADRQRRRGWLSYPGRVVGSRTLSTSLSDDLTADQTQCQVAYVRDGREVVFWNRFTATMLRDPAGRDVEVLVNPADAHDAVVGRGLTTGRTFGLFLVLAGVFFAVVGLGIGAAGAIR